MNAVELFEMAQRAGNDAGIAARPTPMVVQEHANMMDDHSPVRREWFVADGVCGFAWINIRCSNTESRRFINALKRAGIVGGINSFNTPIRRDSYYGGFSYWVGEFGQSMQRKVAFANAFARTLTEYGIDAHVGSRMD